MKKYIYALLCTAALTGCQMQEEADSKNWRVDQVNSFIGTDGSHPTSYGGLIPAVSTPFGMTRFSPMTRVNRISVAPYHYQDSAMIGFIATHQPAIWMGDYGFMSLMPQSGKPKLSFVERATPFNHDQEQASPYHYESELQSPNGVLKAEMTATSKTSLMRFEFPENDTQSITVDMSRMKEFEGFIKVLPEQRRIIGYNSDRQHLVGDTPMGPELQNFKGYYVMEFDRDIEDFGVYRDTARSEGEQKILEFPGQLEITAAKVGAWITFKNTNQKEVEVRIASSFISEEQALNNLEKELAEQSFEQVAQQNKEEWEDYLSRFEVKGGSSDQQAVFYTSLYNALIYPRKFSEFGKYYSAMDDSIHEGVAYNDYSLWDTFRALHPLLLYLAPEHVNPMINSLLDMYDQSGWIPKWPNPGFTNIMIGTHADAVIADAMVKGFDGFDTQKAYEAIYKNAMTPPDGDANNEWGDRAWYTAYEARGGLSHYKKLGYVPADKTKESVSRTLEFAYDDYCVAQVAQILDKTEDYKLFMERSKNYKHLYNPESGFMHARLSNGKFAEEVDHNRSFTEGSPWTYLFCAMQDVDGLVETMGPQTFTEMLDRNFIEDHYRHSNEPGHHYAYLYNWVGQSNKTQKLVNEIVNTKYLNRPDGLCGNDDCGQMSAWYVFSAMGFYPVAPGSPYYALGTPLFEEMQMRIDPRNEEHTFTIKTENYHPDHIYVDKVLLDGEELPNMFITHDQIMNGKELLFVMKNKKQVAESR